MNMGTIVQQPEAEEQLSLTSGFEPSTLKAALPGSKHADRASLLKACLAKLSIERAYPCVTSLRLEPARHIHHSGEREQQEQRAAHVLHGTLGHIAPQV